MLIIHDATGMRDGELEGPALGDPDPDRWSLAPCPFAREGPPRALGRRGGALFAAVDALVPREDRDLGVQIGE